MENPKYAIILGKQRSGTTGLGLALNSIDGLRSWGEVFHHVRGPHDDPHYERFYVQPEASFFSFRQTLYGKYSELAFPTAKNQFAIWRRFLLHLENLAPGRIRHLMDVKYNMSHHLDPVYHSQFEKPLLLDAIAQDAAPVIHIIRRDTLAQAISLLRAQQTGVWHAPAGAKRREQGVAGFKVDPTQLFWTMERSRWEIERFSSYLKGYPKVLVISYEDLYEGSGTMSQSVISAICELLQVSNCGVLAPPLGKLNKDPFDDVINREEVVDYLLGTRYAEAVERARNQRCGEIKVDHSA